MKKKICIFRIGGLGDTIVTLPFFHKINEVHKTSKKYLLFNTSKNINNSINASSLLINSTLVDKFIEYKLDNFKDKADLFFKIKNIHFDELYYLVPRTNLFQVIRDFIFFKLAGVRKVYGLPFKKKFRENMKIKESNCIERETDRYQRCLNFDNLKLNDFTNWSLKVNNREKIIARKIIKEMNINKRETIVLHIFGKRDGKGYWFQNNWKRIIKFLDNFNLKLNICFVGSKYESLKVKQIMSNIKKQNTYNFCGSNTRIFSEVLKYSTLFIGHDSGPLHLANLNKINTIGIHGGFDYPNKWFSYNPKSLVFHGYNDVNNVNLFKVKNKISQILHNL